MKCGRRPHLRAANWCLFAHRNGRLIEDHQRGTWAPGAGLDVIDTTGWPEGRAGFVWAALGSIEFNIAMNSLPNELQQWITDAAAA